MVFSPFLSPLHSSESLPKIRRERLDVIPFAQSLTMQLVTEPYKNLSYLRPSEIAKMIGESSIQEMRTTTLKRAIYNMYGTDKAPRIIAILSNICNPSEIIPPGAFVSNLPSLSSSLEGLRGKVQTSVELYEQVTELAKRSDRATTGSAMKDISREMALILTHAVQSQEALGLSHNFIKKLEQARDWMAGGGYDSWYFDHPVRSLRQMYLDDISRATYGEVINAIGKFEGTVEEALKAI